MKIWVALATVVVALSACAPNPVQVVQPISAEAVDNSHVTTVNVTIGETAMEAMREFDAKAADYRTEAGLAPLSADDALATRPSEDEYRTLPFTTMMPLVIEDVTRDWGLIGGRDVQLDITIDTIKTANAGMAILAGSSDQLAGTVSVSDAGTGQPLGEFYVDVINSHGGLFGMMIRGGGVREKLVEEFALHISRQLTGRENRD